MSSLIHLLSDALPKATGPAMLVGLVVVYAIAAVFSGLSGFGFSAIGSVSLLALSPQQGVPLLMGLSLITRASSLKSLWPECRMHCKLSHPGIGLMPYLVGGAAVCLWAC
jgi:hypothetical protein